MNRKELIEYIEEIINSRHDGVQSIFAEASGLSTAYVNDVLRGRREPGKKILDAVGVERVVSYRVKGV